MNKYRTMNLTFFMQYIKVGESGGSDVLLKYYCLAVVRSVCYFTKESKTVCLDEDKLKQVKAMNAGSLTYNAISGNPLIYIDSPEAMSVGANTYCYLYERPIGTTLKEVEMYCIIYNGDSSSSNALHAGVVLRNTNASVVNVSYIAYGDCQKHGTGDSKYALESVPPVLNKFWSQGAFTPSTIPANGYLFINPIAGKKFVAANAGMFITVRIKLMRMVVGGKNTASNLPGFFSVATPLPPSPTDPNDKSRICGEVPGSIKVPTTTINVEAAISGNIQYTLFRWPGITAQNEYDTIASANHKVNTASKHMANYGVIYRIKLTKASGKKMWILPDWSNPERYKASVCFRFNTGTDKWTDRSIITTKGGGWYVSIPAADTTLEVSLPGGNQGNYFLYFAN